LAYYVLERLMATKFPFLQKDRRSGEERRKEDLGSPFRVERRRTPEPRKPEVTEVDLTPSEWGRLDAAVPPKRK
jgi:hypothetical protein